VNGLSASQLGGYPLRDVRHHLLLVDIVQQIVEVAVVKLERLVLRARDLVEELRHRWRPDQDDLTAIL
jgi:hypothetical protein